MTRTRELLVATTALAALSGPVFADVSADDVWQNLGAALEASGGVSVAERVRTGADLSVEGHRIQFDLPMGLGALAIEMSDYLLREEGGAVRLIYPMPYSLRVTGEIYGEGSFSADMMMEADAYETLATGDPGAISYASVVGPSTFTLTDIAIDGMEEMPGFSVDAQVTIDGLRSDTRVVEDKLIVIYSRSEVGETVTDFVFTDGAGTYSESMSTAGPTVSTSNLGLIPGGADILNLTSALNEGMYITLDASGGGGTSHSLTRLDGELIQEQDYSYDGSEMSFSLDRSALSLSGVARGLLMNMRLPAGSGPASMGFDAGEMGMAMRMPLLASDVPQAFGSGFNLLDFRMSPTIWALFDPEKVLPRGPASLDIDVGGELLLGADLPDLLALAELGGSEEVPIQVTAIDIARFAFSALGITADSEGRFELDYEDYSVIPGVPWPRGSGRAEVEGLNGAIDRFVELGLIGDEEVFGLRLMISLGAIVIGDDRLTSEIEFTEDGRIIANGQQLR